MNISKTTFNMASRRGIELELGTDSDLLGREYPVLLIHGHCDSDAMATYRIKSDGLFYVCAGYGEDWPCWIQSDASLRTYLDSMAEALLS